ncbi:RHS repeat-associated core domain-containing protein [Streptomyces polygonati]|uniref:RHS repeat-associated core domain-containing protein n=1 Tax=Streptomyces polygonati TaxID=1617087 RepID=A0ABV8I3Q4_9ACTN
MTAVVGALAVCAALLGTATTATAAVREPPAPPHGKPVPVTAVASHYHRPVTVPDYRPSPVSWPVGEARVALPAAGSPAAGAGADARTDTPSGRTDAAPTAAAPVRAGSLPVWIGPAKTGRAAKTTAGTAAGTAAGTGGKTAAETPAPASASAPAAVDVDLLPRDRASAAGVSGVLLSLDRADGVATPADVSLTLGYGSFATAFGGDWASRLHLVSLPACVLTTPQLAQCRTQTPLASTDNAQTQTLTAPVAVAAAAPAAEARSAGAVTPKTVLAALSSAGGGGGDFSATTLSPAGSWQAGGSSDAFDWSYPFSVPGAPGGLAPKLGLGYDSQAVDGLVSSTNNQAPITGDGFSLPSSYVERSYQSCHQNPTGTTKTWDNCWSANNQLTLSLNGQTSALIKDDTTGTYHPMGDSNERVQYLTGASNGAQSGEYFRVTTDDGTQYTFGLDELPGWASGDTKTNSVLTEPVYATASGQPCYNATFASSYCQQAYRWNLDYVKDTHGDVMSYFYTVDTGYYARDLGTTANTSYSRDSRLSTIQYGQRDGSVYTTTPSAKVTFGYNGRCRTSATGCATSTLTSSTATNWPDVPYDLYCASGASCSVNSPSFWSEYELSSVQTQALSGTTTYNVDNWAFTYSFPPTGDVTTPSLWLSTLVHTGQDTTGGGSSSAIAMKPMVFAGTPLSNRVNLTDGYPPITRYRLNTVTTETGAVISVGYSAPACGSGTPSDPSQNTKLCYPAYWTPTGAAAPIEDWFNKYIVTGVTQQDPFGGGVNDTIATSYTPIGLPAWHYDDNPLTLSSQRTWNQFRGYQGMKVSVGTSPDPVTETDYTYFRGMDGDTLPSGGSRSVTIADSRGDTPVTDSGQFAGQTYETITYNGSGSGKVVSDTVVTPWTSAATATHALGGGLPSQQAFMTGTADSKVYTPLASGATRTTETAFGHDADGRVTTTDDLGDTSTAADDLCTTTGYTQNTAAWILDTVNEVRTVAVKCATTPSLPRDAVSDTLTYYDNSTSLTATPTIGDPTETRSATGYTGSTPVYTTEASTTVDEYGRSLTSTDADQRTVSTAYTPATGAEPTTITWTDPLTHVTTKTYDPLRDVPLTTVDAAGYKASGTYDALGRVIQVFEPGVSSAVTKYSYAVKNDDPSVVTTQSLNDDGTYRSATMIYDALLRVRETQTPTPDGSRDVSDTTYNTDGWVAKDSSPYNASGAPDGTLVQAQDGQIPSETGYTYDGAGRKTVSTAYALGTATWHTSTIYGGDFTTTVPPAGATAQSLLTDGRGRVTDLYEYHSGVPADPTDPAADYSDTHYTFNPSGTRASQTDAAGNTWSWQYNLLGQEVSATDPDSGTGTTAYDNAGQVTSTTDTRGKQVSYSYDADGRKTAAYDTTGNAAKSASDQIGSWTYDTLKKGLLTGSTSYQLGTASPSITSTALAYNTFGKVVANKTTLANLPADEAALAPSTGYTTSYTYESTGALATQGDPAEGGLPAESLDFGYDALGEPTSLASGGTNAWTYVGAVGYDEYGKPLQYTFGPTTDWAALTLSYDPQTAALTDAKTTDSSSTTVVDDTRYSWQNTAVSKGAGLLTSTTDAQNSGASTDTQCYTYDWSDRLSSAWTATDNCAATPTSAASSTVGGPSPYWQSWTYTADGQRKTQTDHDTGGNTAADTTTTYNYPAAGSATDQPQTLSSTSAVGPAAAANTADYTYDADGNTLSISGGAAGAQTMTWNDQGKLATDTTSSGTTSYLYDADGALVLRTDPNQATLLIGDAQIVEDLSTHALTANRYYSIAGVTIAERSSTGDVQYLIPNRQGTDTLAIDYQTQSVTRRQYLPFGQDRGGSATAWPGNRGFVGGTADPATNLENLGAREYDAVTGRFISEDNVFETMDTNQLSGYDYAGNDPVTLSDPTGLDNWWADPTMNKPVVAGAPPIQQSLADAEGFGSLCNASNCSNYHPHPVFITPHFGFSANTPNVKKLAAAFSKALKAHYDKEFDPRASTYKMPDAMLSYGNEVGTWDDVCTGHPDLCSKSFAAEVNGLHAALDKQAKANERGTMCIFFGQCHWAKVTAAATVFFRTMRAGPDGKPMIGSGSRNLGARPPDYEENLDEDGNIVVDEPGVVPPGLSTATSPTKMVPGVRPNWLPGGKSKDPLWAIKGSSLEETGVTPRPQVGKTYHILLGPNESGTSPEDYGSAIESTQDLWINTQAQSMEDVQAFMAEMEAEE